MTKALLVYPRFSLTFWLYRGLLKFVGKKGAFPPAGLISVAGILPELWQKKLVDMNVEELTDKDIKWANYVFVSAMTTQLESTKEVISRCKTLGVPVIMGGPIFELGPERFPDVAHCFIGEAEYTLLEFLDDLEHGRAKRIYCATEFPDISRSPAPLWKGLVDPNNYASWLISFCRGCPHSCTFCNIATLNGKMPRTKTIDQILAELNHLYEAGFRGAVIFADDNFIGNKRAAKKLVEVLVVWQKERGYPFEFSAEVSVVLADDPDLMDTMVRACFKNVFLGLETPNNACLEECKKAQNTKRDMRIVVREMQRHGLRPMSGFIVGFDNDDPANFDQMMIEFIQGTGIVVAMVGVLQAQQGSALYQAMGKQGRLLGDASGNNLDCCPNFRPKMPVEQLVGGYKRIMRTIYSPRKYFERICIFLERCNASKRPKRKLSLVGVQTFFRSVWWIGILGGPVVSYYYWRTLAFALLKNPRTFPDAVTLQIYGVHFRQIVKGIMRS